MKFPIEQKFTLSNQFLEKYKNIKPDFGFNGLGEFVFMRTYSRLKENGKNESWLEVVKRVVEGIYSIQKQHIEDYGLGWNQTKAQKSAQIMFDKIFNFKMLVSGRALWAMGTPLIMEKGLSPALFNCSFLTTENIKEDAGLPFANAMDFLMLGVGVGFDTLGSGKIIVQNQKEKEDVYIIPDTREGWVESLHLLINSFFGGNKYIFDYSKIRKEGKPIKTFGGTSAGSKPLIELHDAINKIFNDNKVIGKEISVTNIVDIMNLIGKAVVAGNVRRSAELALGFPTEEFLNLKNYSLNPKREKFGWASNNSIYAEIGMDYSVVSERIKDNAEPGLIWLSNFKNNGRMGDGNTSDHRIMGGNPCLEIGLESSELCNLVEMIPSNHESLEEFKSTIKYSYLFAKSITLLNTHWQSTNRVMLRNRRIGLSITGITNFLADHNIETLRQWLTEGYDTAKQYDEIYSDWFAIPESIKITTAKPSGTLSLLAGMPPGIHFPESKYYIRRIRLGNDSPFISLLKNAGYNIEPAVGQENSTMVVEFPIFIGENVRTLNEVSMWEQLSLASFIQKYWSDNSVSVTITFKPHEENDIVNALNYYQYQLKAVSFLPKYESKAYPQMPYEEITKEQYENMKNKLKEINFDLLTSYESIGEKYCNNDVCEI